MHHPDNLGHECNIARTYWGNGGSVVITCHVGKQGGTSGMSSNVTWPVVHLQLESQKQEWGQGSETKCFDKLETFCHRCTVIKGTERYVMMQAIFALYSLTIKENAELEKTFILLTLSLSSFLFPLILNLCLIHTYTHTHSLSFYFHIKYFDLPFSLRLFSFSL